MSVDPASASVGLVEVRTEGALAFVTLSQVGKLNAMSRAMWAGLQRAFEELQTAASVRCIVVAGAAGHFCAGGDIAEYRGFRFAHGSLRHFHEVEVWGALQAMLDCDVPMLAAISGNCLGAGLEIASCCDIRIAASDARFGAPIARLGFPMAPRELQLVASQVGPAIARGMVLEAAVLNAPSMQNCGFLNRVVMPQALAAEVGETTLRIRALAPQAARHNKRTLRALRSTLAPAAQDDAFGYAASAEHREGVAAFLDRRAPVF